MKLESNRRMWDVEYEWSAGRDGEEWSEAWGGSAAQWESAILPRIHRFVPAGTILEIAPGHGRWTHFLRRLCTRLIVVDLSATCIEACRARFAGDSHLEYHVNDGMSLDMIEDGSVDFVFSFDSLVHADAGVMTAYLTQLGRKLRDGGAGFIHHSNLGMYRGLTMLTVLERRPWAPSFRRVYERVVREHLRDRTMSARRFRSACAAAGLSCDRQELVDWYGSHRLIDCLSTFHHDRTAGRSTRVVRNPRFMAEAARIRGGG